MREDVLAAGRFVSKTKLAERLGVTERAIKSMRERGLPGRTISHKTVLFDVNEVDGWIAQHPRS